MNIDQLIKKLTLKEKVMLFVGLDNWRTRPIDRLGIPSLRVTDGPHGTRYIDDENQTVDSGLPATCFPTASAMAATWNVELIEKVGAALGIETRAKGAHILLGPAVNIHRTPLGGRNFEYFSEDPYLAGRMAVAYIKGLQSQGVGASIKHFACNNSEFERMSISSEVGERALHEIYLPAFRAAVLEANPWTVMCSYNKINGVYASENDYLMVDLLKEMWGFEGFVVSDWGAVHDRVRSAGAGLDLEMPGNPDVFPEELYQAVRKKIVREDVLDDKLKRIFGVMEKAGVFDHAEPKILSTKTPEQQQIACEAACEVMVLLKNENQVLPIMSSRVKTIGVFGYLADEPTIEGGGSSRVTPYYTTKPLEELKRLSENQFEIYFETGLSLREGIPVIEDIERTLELAEKVDIALVFCGMPGLFETEGADRQSMDLPGEQVDFIQKVSAVNRNTVVILQNGSPVELAPWIDGVPAVLEAWYAGQEFGRAMASILLGLVNPSGKLPMTLPMRRKDHSDFLNYPGENGKVHYGEGIFVGYRYFDAKDVAPRFPFGYGLSYTQFEYDQLFVDVAGLVDHKPGMIEFTVKNCGEIAGKETAQVYIHDPESRLVRPVKELKGFKKIWLKAGEMKKVNLEIALYDLSYYDPAEFAWVAEFGEYEVWIGSSSRDIRLKTSFMLPETVILDQKGRIIRMDKGYRLSVDSLIRDIMADEEGKKVLLKFLGKYEKDPRLVLAQGYSIRQISMYAPGELPAEVVMKLDRALRSID